MLSYDMDLGDVLLCDMEVFDVLSCDMEVCDVLSCDMEVCDGLLYDTVHAFIFSLGHFCTMINISSCLFTMLKKWLTNETAFEFLP